MSEPTRVRQRTRLRGNQGAITKTVVHKVRGEEVDRAEAVERFDGEELVNPAYVTMGGKYTKNLGNYESVQISSSVTLPCKPDDESIREAAGKASGFVDEFIEKELDTIENE